MACGFTYTPPYRLTPDIPLAGPATFLRHPITWLPTDQVPRTHTNPHHTPQRTRGGISTRRWLVSLRHHGRDITGTGISTRYPSTTPVGLALGPDSPWAEQPGPGTLGHTAGEILTRLTLLMPAFSLAQVPRLGHPAASSPARRSPTHPHNHTPPQRGRKSSRVNAAASAMCLSPATLSAQDHSTSELLRTLSRMAASEPTSWLSEQSHILSH